MRWYSVAVALLAALALLASTVQAVDVHQAPKKAQLQSNRFGEPVGDAKTKPAVTSVPPVVPDIVDLLEKKKALQQLVNNYKTKISQNKAAIEQAKKDIAAATELKSQAEHNVTTLKFQVESTHAQLIFVQRNVTDLKVKVQGWDLAKLKALAYHAMNANPPSESGAFEAARSNLHEADVRVTGLYNDLLVISDFISEKVYGPGHVPHSTELQNLLESIAAVEKQIKGVEAKVLDQKGKMSNIEMIVKKHDEVIESYNQLILKAKPLIKQLEELLIQIKSPKQTCPCMKHCPEVDHCSCKDGKLHYKGEVLATVVSKGSIDNCSPTRTVANAGKQF